MIPAMVAVVYVLISVGALIWMIIGKDKMMTDIIAGWGATVGFGISAAYFEANLVYDVVGGEIHYLGAQSIGYLLYAFSFVAFIILVIKGYEAITDYIQMSDDTVNANNNGFDSPTQDDRRMMAGVPISHLITLIVVVGAILISGQFIQAIFTSISTESASASEGLQFTAFRIIATQSQVIVLLLMIAVLIGGFTIIRRVSQSTR